VITGIVLAAGTASRMGETKQLLELDGKPLVQHVVDAAAAADLDEIVVVLGHEAGRVREALKLPENARTVENPDYPQGQSTSLATGLAAAHPSSEAALVLLGDQPDIPAKVLRELIAAWRESGARILRGRFRNAPGPALLSREVWGEISRLTGDTGARELIAAHPHWVQELAFESDAPPDVDTWQDYERLRY